MNDGCVQYFIDKNFKDKISSYLLKIQYGIRAQDTKELNLCKKLESCVDPEDLRKKLKTVTSISVQTEYPLEGTLNFKFWKSMVLNILEQHELDTYASIAMEEPTSNAGYMNFKKNQDKAK